MVLINDTVKKYLLKQSNNYKQKIREKFEFLETGLWDGGLKVKKLKGTIKKYLFEARVDKGNRILFTLGYSQKSNKTDEKGNLLIYVWGIVTHDNVPTKTQTIIPHNAPFLQFTHSDDILLEDVVMEDLEPDYFTQETITQRTSHDSGSQRWYTIDEPEWKRIRMYKRNSNEDLELFLHLTPQQKEILNTPLPLTVSGTAGSGKTSLAVYYLLNQNLNKTKKLFITYNYHLKHFTRMLYTGLLNQREWKNDVLLPDFHTFKELCLQNTEPGKFPPEQEVDFNRFHHMYTTNPMSQTYDAALVWEEIRAIIKGAPPRDNQAKYLSYHEYETLGKKKAPNFKFNRKEIYQIFQWYQNKLETENLWDELDLSRSNIKQSKHPTYDIVVCDEVQDFTDLQLDLLFRRVKNPKNLFLAGDTRQTVNPSAFRWEDVRNHFYRRKTENPDLKLEVPELRHLTLNFRSSGSIVELANMVLELKEKFTGKQSDQSREEWKYKGRPVNVVSDIETDHMLEMLKTPGAHRTILVRTESEKKDLKNRLAALDVDTELVFTIKEAKGLEFDTVVLWKFNRDQAAESEDIWKVTLDMSNRNIHEARIKHEISLLYVGITRAVQDLIVYDGPSPSLIWEAEPLKNNVYITSDREYIESIWNVVTTPDQWLEKGRYFFQRKFYTAAVECFKNGGDAGNLAKARAYYYQQTGNHAEAASYFEKTGQTEKAAAHYEAAQNQKKALALWESLNNRHRATQCRAAILKAGGNYREAGQLYLEITAHEKAVECFKKSKNYSRAAEIYRDHLNDPKRAAHYYESARDFGNAAKLYAVSDMPDKAAELYFMNKNYPQAQTLWEKTGNTKQLLKLYRKTGQKEKLLSLYEQEEDLEKTVKYLESMNPDIEALKSEAAEQLEKGRYFPALARYTAAGDNRGAAACYSGMEKYREAVYHYEKAGDMKSAAGIYFKTGHFEQALRMYIYDPEDRADGYTRTREAVNKIRDRRFLIDLAFDCYYSENIDGAFLLFSHLGGFEPQEGVCRALNGYREKAFETWAHCRGFGQWLDWADACLEHNLVETGGDFILSIADGKTGTDKSVFSNPLENTSIFALMDAYYKNVKDRDPEEAALKIYRWGMLILEQDIHYRNWGLLHIYLPGDDDINNLVLYFRRFLKEHPERGKEAALEIYSQLRTAHAQMAFQSAAFIHLLFGDREDLNRLLRVVPIREKNFVLFMFGNEENREKMTRFIDENDLTDEVERFEKALAETGSIISEEEDNNGEEMK